MSWFQKYRPVPIAITSFFCWELHLFLEWYYAEGHTTTPTTELVGLVLGVLAALVWFGKQYLITGPGVEK